MEKTRPATNTINPTQLKWVDNFSVWLNGAEKLQSWYTMTKFDEYSVTQI
jgi:hypothetical protein